MQMADNMKNKLIRLLYDLFSFILTITSLSFNSKTCKRFLHKAKAEPYDIIIVPGVPFKNHKWDPIMKARVYWAKYLYENRIAKNVMFSGAAVYTPYIESEIMALYAKAIGIPRENIYTETIAEHSTENVYYSYKKARQLGFDRIALASDPFQTKMLRRFTVEKVSPEIGFLPVVYDILRKKHAEMTDPEIDHHGILVKDFTSLRERAGIRRRFNGTRGFDIDPNAYN
jgi:uncharacterized SAM-binding protein YcdF (DUF218 family)